MDDPRTPMTPSPTDHLPVPCQRCGVPLRLAPAASPTTRLLRRAATPTGLCATCAVRAWLEASPLLPQLVLHGPEVFLAPHLQASFARLMQAGGAQMTPEEIDWERLVAEWNLPLPGSGAGPRRKAPRQAHR